MLPSENPPDRPARWIIAAQLVLTVCVVVAIVAAVVVLRQTSPHVVTLRQPDATEEPLLANAATPTSLPNTNPDGPIGAIDHAAPEKGKAAPDFALTDLDGRRVQLSDLRGKVVVVNFWATWCGPCKQEFPELQKAYSQAGGDVVVLALDQEEDATRVTRFRDEYGAGFSILMDTRGEVAKSWLLTGIPDTIIVDRRGIVSDVAIGPLSAGSFRYKINQALKAP